MHFGRERFGGEPGASDFKKGNGAAIAVRLPTGPAVQGYQSVGTVAILLVVGVETLAHRGDFRRLCQTGSLAVAAR
jgi:hypothetical protein